tara:strand:- start:6793 stop:7041 length:249 start_codon:yes stop_codon:yes gene_type:complete
VVDGTVSITLKDFQALIDAKLNADTRIDNTQKASKELQVFLSYLCTRVDIEPFVKEFNKQSRTSEIIVEGGHAKIKFKDNIL